MAQSFPVAADTTISALSPRTPHGSDASLVVDGKTQRIALVKFDPGPALRHAIVKKVVFEVFVTNPSAKSFSIFQMQSDWKASQATWEKASNKAAWVGKGASDQADRAKTVLGTFRPKQNGAAEAEVSPEMLGVVQTWLDSPLQNFGLAVVSGDDPDGFIFDSRQGAHPPKLTVTVETPAQQEIHWTFTGAGSVAIEWSGSNEQVFFGETAALGKTASAHAPAPAPRSIDGRKFWEATIDGLASNTLFHYKIGANGAVHTFRTPPPAGSTDFYIHAIGDVGATSAKATPTSYFYVPQVFGVIARDEEARFVLMLGDLTYAGHPKGAGDPSRVDDHFNDAMVWSQDKAYLPAWGNHDWKYQDTLENYKGRFSFPNPQTSLTPKPPCGSTPEWTCAKDWYWFDYGNVRFIAVDEPYHEGKGLGGDDPDRQRWQAKVGPLMDEAEKDSKIRFIVTYGHRSAYASGGEGSDVPLRTVLNELAKTHSKYRLDLCGHSHNYERSKQIGPDGTAVAKGVVHVTAGFGGAPLLPYQCQHSKTVHLDEDDDELEAEKVTPVVSKPGIGGALECSDTIGLPDWSAVRFRHHGTLRLHFTESKIEAVAICAGSQPRQPSDKSPYDSDSMTCTTGAAMDRFIIE